MSRIDWLLKGDPTFTITSSKALAIPVRDIVKLERQPVSNPGEGTVYLPGKYVDPYPLRFDPKNVREKLKRIRPPIMP